MNNNQPQPTTIDQEILQKKITKFHEDLQKLQGEAGIVIVPILKHTRFGVFPDVDYMPREQFDAFISNQTQAVNAAIGK